jgi:Tfp pilus assembly protein PilN
MAEIVAQEIEITWRRLFGRAPDPDLSLFLVASGPLTGALTPALAEKAAVQVIVVDPYARVARAQDVPADLPMAVAQGLALRVLQPPAAGSLDFLAAYRLRTRPQLRLTRELALCGGLAVAALVVWTAGLLLQLSSLEATHQELKKQIEQVFHAALPEEQNVIDPIAQLGQKLEALRKERALLTSRAGGRRSPLEILSALSSTAPAAAGLKLQDVAITADAVHLAGTCDSYALLTEWQHQLEALPGLHFVEVPRGVKDPQSGKVQFTISLSTNPSKA